MGAILASILMRPGEPEYHNEFGIPLPNRMHQVLSAEDIKDKDVLVIGDVHGCCDQLKQFIEQEQVSPENTVVIFCGDVVNKGPKNIEALRYVRKIGAHMVRGNHEEHVIKHYLKLRDECQKCLNGSKSVRESKGEGLREKYKWIIDLTEEEVSYLMELPYTISIPSLDAIVVHAGLFPWKSLERQQPTDMTLMRDIVDIDGEKARATKHIHTGGYQWARYWPGPTHVYFGHDAMRGLQRFSFATGLDTGCLYGNFLSGIYIKGDKQGEIVSVKSENVYKKNKS